MNRRSRWGSIVLAVIGLMAGLSLLADASGNADRQATIQRSRDLLADAQEAFAAGQADSALSRLESILVDDPANPDAYYMIGIIKLSNADTSGAEVALAEGVRKAPLSRRLKLLLARVWVELGRSDEAEKLVAEVMMLRPRDLDALYIKGLIALARSDTTTALELWETALHEELEGVGP